MAKFEIVPESVVPNETTNGVSKTNWEVFSKLNLVIDEIVCQAYRPVHPSDSSCHSRINMTPESLRAHTTGFCGGGFLFTTRTAPSASRLWKELGKSDLEIVNLTCEVCEKQIPVDFLQVKNHLQVHTGKNRRKERGGKFWMTLSTVDALKSTESEDVEFGE